MKVALGLTADGVWLPFRLGRLNVRNGCAPWKGGVFQWVRGPPGNRSSRKQPEQSWR